MPNIRGIISTCKREEDLVVDWRIGGFSTLEKSVGANYISPEFSFGSEKWRLGIAPNGSYGYESSGHMDVWVGKYRSNRSVSLFLSISLRTVKGDFYNEQHGTRCFDDDEQYQPFLRFIPRLEITRRKSDLLADDVLTVVCIMKESTSAGIDSYSACTEICTPVSDSAGCSSDSGECCHCKGIFDTWRLSLHQRQCIERPVKCPECLEVVVMQEFLTEHECHHERSEGEASASGSATSPHEKKVLHDFKELFLQKEDCDVIFKVEGSEIPAHKAILKARSPVFASTFRHDMKEGATGIVDIEDCDSPPFSDFLYFLYCGDIGIISRENVFSIYTLADKYEVLDLKTGCLDFIRNNIAVDTFCETITLALQHTETELINLATDFFVANAEEILVTVKWQTFAAENPTQSNELFIKYVRSIKHSNT